MRFWESITAFGDSGVLLPAAALISLWLVSARQARLAARWCLTVAFVGTTVALSKLLFMGWCLGLRSLDFTGLSGHAAMAGVVLPVLFHLGPMAFRGHRQKGSWLIGTCVAGLIGMSRLALHVHSVSEVVGGLAFGLGCGAVFLHRADRSGKIAIGPQLATIPLLILPGFDITVTGRGSHGAIPENSIDPLTNEPYLQPVRVRLFGEGEHDAVMLGGFLADAYKAAEEFCEEVGKRQGMQLGFLKTILLRRLGSTVAAGRATALTMLSPEHDVGDEDDSEEAPKGSLYPLTVAEGDKLRQVVALLDEATDEDPKYRVVERILLEGIVGTQRWLDRGCIIFSQYYDSVRWVANRLSARLPEEPVALYANVAGSGLYRAGLFTPMARETLKEGVRQGSIRLLVGTDAASEGLNLQALGTLINLDLPWNPTRLEQRKGRIQRIGQRQEEVYIYNMRYRDSVEDRVHQLLSGRLQAIRDMFGQLPDTLEDVWVAVALHDERKAHEVIDQVPATHPFELRYDRIEQVDWESCSTVLHSRTQLEPLLEGW